MATSSHLSKRGFKKMQQSSDVDEDERYVDEFGQPLERYYPKEPENRGLYSTFPSALEKAFSNLLVEKNSFFDTVCEKWDALFPDLPAKPDRFEGGIIFLTVKNSPTLFAMQSKKAMIKRSLMALPDAPKKMVVKFEIGGKV